jgi:hypothetical protein
VVYFTGSCKFPRRNLDEKNLPENTIPVQHRRYRHPVVRRHGQIVLPNFDDRKRRQFAKRRFRFSESAASQNSARKANRQNSAARERGLDGEQKTLVLYILTACRSCNESSPFYKCLVEKYSDGKNVKLVAVLPQTVEAAKEHLGSLGVNIKDFYNNQLSLVGVAAPPTLLFVDESGVVSDMWKGKLCTEKEIKVANTLSNKLVEVLKPPHTLISPQILNSIGIMQTNIQRRLI